MGLNEKFHTNLACQVTLDGRHQLGITLFMCDVYTVEGTYVIGLLRTTLQLLHLQALSAVRLKTFN